MKKVLIYTVSVFMLVTLFYNIDIFNKFEIGNKQKAMINNNISKKYGDIIIKKGNENKKMIALTFDDGQDEDFTPQILDILKK